MIKSWICRANLNHDPNDILSFMVKASTEYSAIVMARKEIDRLKARCMDIRTVDEIRVQELKLLSYGTERELFRNGVHLRDE